jgi:hypothetical protein
MYISIRDVGVPDVSSPIASVTRSQIKKQKKTTTAVTKPNGCTETVTTVETSVEVEKIVVKTTTAPKKTNKLTVDVSVPVEDIKRRVYGVAYEKRLLQSGVWIGIGANTDKQLKLSVGVEL